MTKIVLVCLLINLSLYPMTRDQAEEATNTDNVDMVAKYLAEGHDVNEINDAGWTLLHHAAASGALHTAQLLANHGALINARSTQQATPLHNAAFRGHAQMVSWLAAHGALVDYRLDKTDEIPLHRATLMGHTQAVAALLKAGSPANDLNFCQRTALHYTASRPFPHVHYRTIATLLMLSGANMRLRDCRNQTPFDCALAKQHWSVAGAILRFAEKNNVTDQLEEYAALPLDVRNEIDTQRLTDAELNECNVLLERD